MNRRPIQGAETPPSSTAMDAVEVALMILVPDASEVDPDLGGCIIVP